MMPATVAMISLDLVLAAVVLPGQGVPDTLGILWVVAGVAIPAVLGITDLLGNGDDEEEVAESDDSLFEDDGDDLGGLDGLDDMDGFEDDGGELGGGGGGDQNVTELENRLEELENEISSLSSSVNTVQNENEAVSETVTEVEENVRDLLEIYEMVTRGVNPFVDDAGGTMGGGSGGSFGLFDDESESEEDIDDSIADADAEEFFDDDFDEPGDDLADPAEASVDKSSGAGGDSVAGFDDASSLEDTAEMDTTGIEDNSEDSMDDTDSDDSGKSFEELKQEYESGDPDWDVENPLDGESEDGSATAESTEPVGEEAATDMVDEDLGDGPDGASDDDGSASETVTKEVIDDSQNGSGAAEDPTNEFVFEDSPDPDNAPAGDVGGAGLTEPGGDAGMTAPEETNGALGGGPEPSPSTSGVDSHPSGGEDALGEGGAAGPPDKNGAAGTPQANGTAGSPQSGGAAEKEKGFEFVGEDNTEPDESFHLPEFPKGYSAEMTVLEWLEYLIEVGGKQGARDVLGYYVDVGWISPAVKDELRTYLDGIRRKSQDAEFVGGGISEFDPEHHRQSLRFVARLAEDGNGIAMVERVDGATDLAVGAPKMADQSGGDLDGI